MTYHAPLADMSFALKYGAALLPALEEGFLGDLTIDDVEAVLAEAGRMAAEVIAPLDRVGDRVGASFKDGVVDHRARLERGLSRLVRRRLERPCLAGRMGRSGTAANRQRRLHRNVERRLDGVRPRPVADHGCGRRA